MWAWLPKSLLLMLIEYRYDVAWYGNLAFALVSATLVLLVLLSETTMMHARLALSFIAQRREQGGRLMTMDAVAAAIAHEINQPLAAIVNNGSAALRWLTRAPPEVGKAREALRAMVDDGRRATQVVTSIRAILRRDQPEREELDINAVIEEVLMLDRGECGRRGIAVQTALDPRLPPVSANRVQLQQVLLNLVANAIEAMERARSRPGELKIRTERRGREALVTVEDNGTGIDPQDSGHIFDPFFTTKARGTGLGLAICKSIVEAHGGRMWATPGVACGTVLSFTILLANQG
jgi:signal transduction histidine kinase